MPTLNNRDILEAALSGLEIQQQQLAQRIARVKSMLGQAAPAKKVAGAGKSRPPLSAAARKRIAAAQKKRWADYRKANA